MTNGTESADNEAFTTNECAKSLSYAYGHNKGNPLTESANSYTRIAGDKYALQDYAVDPRPLAKPCNHYHELKEKRKITIIIGRHFVRIDGSAAWDNCRNLLEANPNRDMKTGMSLNDPDYKRLDDSHPESDQTGADWWSDPPDKP